MRAAARLLLQDPRTIARPVAEVPAIIKNLSSVRMPLNLYNTLSGKVEGFAPAQGNLIRMYCCGPTVYDYGHIGNFRTFVAVDILRRWLKAPFSGNARELRHVMNITDVDDKIIRNAREAGQSIDDYTARYRQAFLEDSETINIERPDLIVRATDHIPEMTNLISGLEGKGAAYRVEDGSWYFRIAAFPQYGKLSKKDFAGIEVGARVDVDEYEKDDARDFALWKSPKPGEAKWETPIGSGRPGWHIECSAMAMKYLGQSFDLHAGGEDLIFPHHENEIAQSEAYTGQTFSRHWMHVRFLLVEGKKMSKSLGNFYTLRDLVLMGHKPSSIRFLLTSVPYRQQLNFTFDGLKQAASSVERLRNFRLRLQNAPKQGSGNDYSLSELAQVTQTNFNDALNDDLNTAEALGAIFEMVREANAAIDDGRWNPAQDAPLLLQVMENFDRVFGVLEDRDAAMAARVLDWARKEGKQDKISAEAQALAQSAGVSDAEVERLVAEHVAARKARNFQQSDAIRNQLAEQGILLENMKDGSVRWRRK
jgi:cysteinyl-tRNA synthetase